MLRFHKTGRIYLVLVLLLSSVAVEAQLKGDSYQSWYSWNASAGFMMPLDPFRTSLGSGVPHRYNFSGTPGYSFSISKQVGLQVIIGAELEDLRMKGTMEGYVPAWGEPEYNIRIRTYNLTGEYFFSPISNMNPFILVKAGYGGINRARLGKDLSRTTPADRWDWFFTAGGGLTFHPYPNFSFNLAGEFTPVPNTYLYELFETLPLRERKLMPTIRMVLTLTAHTDIRVFYPRWKVKSRGTKNPDSKGETDSNSPFHRGRTRK